jgi:RNA polymerase sigma-70 factor (ECF subfamily)
MEEASPRTVVRWAPDTGAAEIHNDALLLERFASDRDEAAFALLVQRHGPLVLSVCRRVLGKVQDAEDAFQATFLVLARKAGSIRDPGLLGNWLYGVASRIARKARAGVSKRQMHEKQVRVLPSLQAPATAERSDVGPVLDEELARLPEKYRAALVLCYLEGRTNEEAARLLRWPTGTVKGRLARARELLRSRLARRGLRASAVGVAASLFGARAEAGPVPEVLAAITARAGVGFAGGDGAAGALSPRAVTLAEALLQYLRRARLMGVLLALILLAAGTGGTLVAAGVAAGREVTGSSCHMPCGDTGSLGSGASR